MNGQGSVPSIVPGRPAAAEGTAHRIPFTWTGSPWKLTGICLLNAVLGILTVGIYTFWGRTEIRRRMWSSVRFLGEPLAYHGTPQELLKGFLGVLAVLLAPLFLIGGIVVIAFGQASSVFGVYQLALFAVVYPILTAVAFYRARRYRLARTSWRGIRGAMDGSSGEYGLLSWVLALAYPITLFWIVPYRAIALQRMLISDTQLGSEPLRFEGSSKSLYGRFALLWFGSIALYIAMFGVIAGAIGMRYDPQNPIWWTTLRSSDWAKIVATVLATLFIWSMMSSFYYAKLYNYCAASTEFGRDGGLGLGSHRFHLDVRGRHLIWLFVTNAAITYLSLYILRPVATARSMKYFAEHLTLIGPFEPDRLGQNLIAIDQSGEGLAQAFDLDAF
jgi:uncharacterized membrane protein YjgN (DUF898 family)